MKINKRKNTFSFLVQRYAFYMSLTIFSVWCALVGVEGLANKIIRQGNDKRPTWRLRDPTPTLLIKNPETH